MVGGDEGVVDQLVVGNESLHEENARLKTANRILRTVVRTLRTTNAGLREQIAQAAENDEMFRELCATYKPREISERVGLVEQGGLPDATGTVDSLSADGEKA